MIPDPVELFGTDEVAQHLQVPRRSADRLIRAGLAGPTWRRGNRLMVRAADVANLSSWPEVTSDEPITVIRVAPAAPAVDDPERKFVGWHQDLTQTAPTEAIKAVDRWWSIRDPHIGGLVAFTLAGFVVHAGRLVDVETSYHEARRLILDSDDTKAQALLRHRLETGPGGNVVMVPPASHR